MEPMDAVLSFLQKNAFLVTLGAIAVTILIAWLNYRRESRRLGYLVKSSQILDANRFGTLVGLSISFNGDELRELWIHELVIENIGKRDAIHTDVVGGITFTVQSPILEAALQDGPEGSTIDVLEHSCRISFELLKPSESIRVTLISTSGTAPVVKLRLKDFSTKDLNVPPRRFMLVDLASKAFAALLLWMTIFLVAKLTVLIVAKSPAEDMERLTTQLKEVNQRLQWQISLNGLEDLVRQRAMLRNPPTIEQFSTNNLPTWAASEAAILKWGGPSYVSYEISRLSRNGDVEVKVPAAIIGKDLRKLPADALLLMVVGPKGLSPFKGLQSDGKLVDVRD